MKAFLVHGDSHDQLDTFLFLTVLSVLSAVLTLLSLLQQGSNDALFILFPQETLIP